VVFTFSENKKHFVGLQARKKKRNLWSEFEPLLRQKSTPPTLGSSAGEQTTPSSKGEESVQRCFGPVQLNGFCKNRFFAIFVGEQAIKRLLARSC